jgi:hypothetical protein
MAVRTYIRVTWVAVSQWDKPIATAHTFDDLKLGIDEYFGVGKDQLEWIPYESKYPDDYEGYFKYEVDDFNGGTELEEVRVYCVEFYPHTKYEVDTQKEALIELTNINLEDEN